MIDLSDIHHAVEVGAGDSYSSQLIHYAGQIERIQLIEPNRILAEELEAAVAWEPGVFVHKCAIGAERGIADLVHMGYGSYIVGAPSFLALSCERNATDYWKPLTASVPIVPLKEFEGEFGPIDYLVLTPNGSELAALSTMISRPKLIRTKFYVHNASHGDQVQQVIYWMVERGYQGALVETNQYGTYQDVLWQRIGT